MAQLQQKQDLKELRVDFQMKYKIILKLYELFHMQEFVLSTLVPITQFLSQSSKPLKSATSDTYQPLKADPTVTGKWYIKCSSCYRARNRPF